MSKLGGRPEADDDLIVLAVSRVTTAGPLRETALATNDLSFKVDEAISLELPATTELEFIWEKRRIPPLTKTVLSGKEKNNFLIGLICLLNRYIFCNRNFIFDTR